MSELERQRRANYKKNRKKWMMIQIVAMIAIGCMLLASAILYRQLDKTYYIGYTEDGDIDYKVYLKENDFYDEEYLESGRAYLSTLIENVAAEFQYGIVTGTDSVAYEYSYGINAKLEILDNNTGDPIFDRNYVIKEDARHTKSSGNDLLIKEAVNINYDDYNSLAETFMREFGLSDTTNRLIVTMDVEVIGSSEKFEENSENRYAVSLLIPLTRKTVDINITSTVPNGTNKILAYKGGVDEAIFKNLAIAFGIAELLLTITYVAFVYLTRNHDINYSLKVKKILSAYRSYIQQIEKPFNTEGYQVLFVKSFYEMLCIRDTIQAPILMNENEDETLTQFVIPASASLLYLFELKVENYDEIYGVKQGDEEKEEPQSEEVSTKEPTKEETVFIVDSKIEECDIGDAATGEEVNEHPEESNESSINEEDETCVNEAEEIYVNEAEEIHVNEADAPLIDNSEEAAEESIVENQPNEDREEEPAAIIQSNDENVTEPSVDVADFENEEATRLVNGVVVHVRYRTSFTSRLIQADESIQVNYGVLKNKLLSYKGVKARTSWNYESFNKGRLNLAKLNVRGNEVRLYLALDPEKYADNSKLSYVGDKAKLDKVPMMIRVKGERTLSLAISLIETVMGNHEVPALAEVLSVDYRMPYETNEQLVDKGFVKVLFPDDVIIDENTIIEKLNINNLFTKKEGIVIKESDIVEALAEPTVELEDIDFVDEIDEEYVETEEKPGVEVIGVVWPERPHKNKIYRYDPNGEVLHEGDIVLVPTKDVARNKAVVRKASVAHGNHKIDPNMLMHPLKKIITVVKRKIEDAISAEK